MIPTARTLVRMPPRDTPSAISRATTAAATTRTIHPAFFILEQ